MGAKSTIRCHACGAVSVRIANSYVRKSDGVRVRQGSCTARGCGEPFRDATPDALWLALRAAGVEINRRTLKGRMVPFVSGGLVSGLIASVSG